MPISRSHRRRAWRARWRFFRFPGHTAARTERRQAWKDDWKYWQDAPEQAVIDNLPSHQ